MNRFEHADTPTPSRNPYIVAWCAIRKLHLYSWCDCTFESHAVQEDFVGSAVNVTLLPGDTQVKVSVPTTNDVVLETTEEFYARATLFNSRVSVFESSASILIQDNDGKGAKSNLAIAVSSPINFQRFGCLLSLTSIWWTRTEDR